MGVMEQANEIPCIMCKSWSGERKKFSCNPKKCSKIAALLLEHVPQLSGETIHMQVQLPEIAIQYVV
jgi:hypothetical protein